MREPAFVAATLEWCNERRAEDGLPLLDRLPRGVRKDPTSCPCGTACGWTVGPKFAYRFEAAKDLVLPQGVRDFVVAFDYGELPQYDEALA